MQTAPCLSLFQRARRPYPKADYLGAFPELKAELPSRRLAFTSTNKDLKRAFLIFFAFTAQAFGSGLAPYTQLIVSDSRATPRNGVRVTYLGTNGFQFESGRHTLLVDPYFSRIDFSRVVLGLPVQPDVHRIDEAMTHLAWKVDAIVVTHGHIDHLLDAPLLMRKTEARLIASRTAIELARTRRRARIAM